MAVAGRRCAVAGCARPHAARGLCRMHYGRAVTAGALPPTTAERSDGPTCPRCTVQQQALAADGGYGDRQTLFMAMTRSEFSAYLLGLLDGKGGDVNAGDKARAIRRGQIVKWWK